MGAGIRSEQETRVINLEARLQELSETVGTYDRLRQQDQASIQKLKERVHQLEGEKSTLLLSSASCTSSARSSPDFGNEAEEKSPSKTRIQLLESQSKILSLNSEVSNQKKEAEKLRLDLDKCNEELSRYEE